MVWSHSLAFLCQIFEYRQFAVAETLGSTLCRLSTDALVSLEAAVAFRLFDGTPLIIERRAGRLSGCP
jgi:hypothetical protein